MEIIGIVGGLVGVLFGVYQYFHRKKDEKEKVLIDHHAKKEIDREENRVKAQSAENQYRDILKGELQKIGLAGTEFPSKFLPFDRTFVSLRLTESSHCEDALALTGNDSRVMHGNRRGRDMFTDGEKEMHLSPEQVMARAFQNSRLLLVIGDPGSGKTTLLNHYTLTCLDHNHDSLGFKEKEILPLYFPLRELKFSDGLPRSLQDNLASWSGLGHRAIPASEFETWLRENNTLVLLDGLDEISERDKRRQVCRWVKQALDNFTGVRFVLTSRPTGIRKLDGVELECEYRRADILDFSPQQQERFLRKWYDALYLQNLAADASPAQKEAGKKEAADLARAIIDYLNKEENKSIRLLARSPMILQIMAILWDDRHYLPGSRGRLYDISLNYLLEYRDDRRGLKPLLPAGKVRSVLAPVALWMQETLRSEFAPKNEMHGRVQAILRKMDQAPEAPLLFENLQNRAGLISDYGKDHYIFRHKSFMEYLAAVQLLEDCRENHRRMRALVDSFNDDWWEESLRFFIGESNDKLFDRFMRSFFKSKVSRDLNSNKQMLLESLVKEAPMREISGMVQYLNTTNADEKQIRYILNCLKIIDTAESIGAVAAFLEKNKGDRANLDLARQIAAEMGIKYGFKFREKVEVEPGRPGMPNSFRNPFEDNVEYIKIPGGSYKFSVTEKMATVPDLYFCKYLVTNKRYRKFISYLEGKEKALEETLPLKSFAEQLMEFAGAIKKYPDYLGKSPHEWGKKLRSNYDDDKKYNGDDQPVVGIAWYGARAYCLWLSCLHREDGLYRLPTEMEWEWAAAGREPDGSLRKYPWATIKGEPTPELANYENNVGATTPVGRYPEGATPEGLMDMAGNAWEWMENLYDEDKEFRALRGGSWHLLSDGLRCVARGDDNPWYYWVSVGFRVVFLCSPGHTPQCSIIRHSDHPDIRNDNSGKSPGSPSL